MEKYEKVIEKIQRKIHPLFYRALIKHRDFNINISSQSATVDENTPFIFAANHYGMDDIPIVCEVVKRHVFVLISSIDRMTINGMLMCANGVVWVNRLEKESKAEAKRALLRHLSLGRSILLFPEGVWNISPNLLMLPMHYGIIDISLVANVPIIPIVTHYNNGSYHVRIGDAFHPATDKRTSICRLRDIMATYLYELIESVSLEKKENVSFDCFEKDILRRFNQYPRARKNPKSHIEYESRFIFQPKEVITADKAFAHLSNITITKENAFLLKNPENKQLLINGKAEDKYAIGVGAF